MTAYDVTLTGREEIAQCTLAVWFEKPAGFGFKAGQAIDLVLGDPQGSAQAGRHTFSLVSAPFQAELVVATRLRDSAFKRTLNSLPIGAPARIEGPFGSLTLPSNPARPAVLIAGGIGITPFISMLRQAANDASTQRLLLVYSNRRPEDAAFLPELRELEQRNKSFRLVATMTQTSASSRPWTGETARIDADLLRRVTSDLSRPIYYVVGPPAMVEAVRAALSRVGADDGDIRSEAFYGY